MAKNKINQPQLPEHAIESPFPKWPGYIIPPVPFLGDDYQRSLRIIAACTTEDDDRIDMLKNWTMCAGAVRSWHMSGESFDPTSIDYSGVTVPLKIVRWINLIMTPLINEALSLKD